MEVLRRALLGLALSGALGSSVAQAETVATGLLGSPNAAGWVWYVGIDKGFFQEADITLDLIYAPTPAGLVQQLAGGSLDIVADTGVVEPIHAIDRGAPVALMRIMGAVPPYELVAKPDIHSIKELKGRTMVIGGLADINRVYLERVIQPNGLKDGDFDITVIGNTAGRFAALKSGAADATMLAPPVNFYAEAAGFHNIGMVIDYAKDLPFSGTDTSLAYAAKHHDTLVRLLAAVDKSVAWFDDDAHRDEAIDILAKLMKGGNRDDVAKSYDYLRKIDYFAHDNRVSRKSLQGLIAAMKALGDINGDIAVDRLVIPELTRIVD